MRVINIYDVQSDKLQNLNDSSLSITFKGQGQVGVVIKTLLILM